MSSLKKLRKKLKNKKNIKMSQVIADFSHDIVAHGDNLYEKQNYLNCACSAWNISLLPKNKREERLKQIVSDYIKYNPESSNSDNYVHNLRELIQRKDELFPQIKKPILEAKIEENENVNTITVVSSSLSKNTK